MQLIRQNVCHFGENVLKYLGNTHQLVDVISLTAQVLHILLKLDLLIAIIIEKYALWVH